MYFFIPLFYFILRLYIYFLKYILVIASYISDIFFISFHASIVAFNIIWQRILFSMQLLIIDKDSISLTYI